MRKYDLAANGQIRAADEFTCVRNVSSSSRRGREHEPRRDCGRRSASVGSDRTARSRAQRERNRVARGSAATRRALGHDDALRNGLGQTLIEGSSTAGSGGAKFAEPLEASRARVVAGDRAGSNSAARPDGYLGAAACSRVRSATTRASRPPNPTRLPPREVAFDPIGLRPYPGALLDLRRMGDHGMVLSNRFHQRDIEQFVSRFACFATARDPRRVLTSHLEPAPVWGVRGPLSHPRLLPHCRGASPAGARGRAAPPVWPGSVT